MPLVDVSVVVTVVENDVVSVTVLVVVAVTAAVVSVTVSVSTVVDVTGIVSSLVEVTDIVTAVDTVDVLVWVIVVFVADCARLHGSNVGRTTIPVDTSNEARRIIWR